MRRLIAITAGKVRDEWKLLSARYDRLKAKNIIRVYAMSDSRIPEEVLEETETGTFHQPATGEQWAWINNKLVPC